jgi:hypothetical protein
MQCSSRRARGWGWPGSTEEVEWRAGARAAGSSCGWSSSVPPSHKFQSHPGVPTGRLIAVRVVDSARAQAVMVLGGGGEEGVLGEDS